VRLLVVAGAYGVLALLYTYPLVLAPERANRFDAPDALLSAWILSWDLHQIVEEPLRLFDANIFFPERGTLAYSENLLTAALLVAPIRVFSDNPILLVNAALLLALTLSGVATFALAREFGCSTAGAGLAGLLFAFAPFRWAHLSHLQLQLAFPLPAAFCFTRRLIQGGGFGNAVGLGVSLAAAFGASGYYALYLLTALPPFAFFDALGRDKTERRRAGRRLLCGAALGVALAAPLVLPYAFKLESGARRSLGEAASFSAGAVSYTTSLSRLHFFLPKASEPLFPGFVALGLAGLALVASLKREGSRRNELLWLGVGMLGVWLSLGPAFGLFSALWHVVPGYQGLRVPSRAGVLFLLAVAILAGIGLSHIRRRRLRYALLIGVGAECFAGPLPLTLTPPPIPPVYARLAELSEPGALLELPLPHPDRFQDNALYVYRSIFHWRPLVNGYSGFVPESYREAHRLLGQEDFAQSLSAFKAKGVRLVLAHTGRLGPRLTRKFQEAEDSGRLTLLFDENGDRLYRIS
jgi:hypothetical protein